MTENKIEKMDYEEAFGALEKVVAALEEEQKSLADSISLFERGQALTKHCSDLLNEAELKVQELTEEGDLVDFAE